MQSGAMHECFARCLASFGQDPAVQAEDDDPHNLWFGASVIGSIDIYYAIWLCSAQKRALQQWVASINRGRAERAAWRSNMSSLFTRRAAAEEMTVPLQSVEGSKYRGQRTVKVPMPRVGSPTSPMAPSTSSAGAGLSPRSRDYKLSTDYRSGLHYSTPSFHRNAAPASHKQLQAEAAAAEAAEADAWRALKAWRLLRIWKLRTEERRRRQLVAKKALARMRLDADGRRKARGMHAFAARAPHWSAGALALASFQGARGTARRLRAS